MRALFYLFTDLLVGTKQRKFSWHPDRRRWRSTYPYPLSHPTWWSSSPIFMRTTRPPPRHCSVLAAVPLCPPTLECVATVVRMSISATSAGKKLVSFTGLKWDTHERVFLSLCCLLLSGPSTMMKKTPSCATPVASVNMPALISCFMPNHVVLWTPLRMRKTGRR